MLAPRFPALESCSAGSHGPPVARFAAFETAVAGLTGCLEVQPVTGEFDSFVKLRIQGIDSFNDCMRRS
jgi:hypothetical protein